MKNAARVGGLSVLLVLCFVLWYAVVSDYGDSVTSGTYHLAQNGETSTLVLKPDHSFQQELNKFGRVERATGTWRRIGEGGVAFSKEFLTVSGQELDPDGTAFGDVNKDFGFLVSIKLRQYHVLWYGRVDPSSNHPVSGTYTGDREGTPSTLVLKEDHAFDQTIGHLGIEKHAEGTWSLNKVGDVVFSRGVSENFRRNARRRRDGFCLGAERLQSPDRNRHDFQVRRADISEKATPLVGGWAVFH